MSRNRLLLVAVLLALAPAVPVRAQATDCSVNGQNTYVHDVLFDYYYWYTQLPDVSPSAYGSPADYLEAVRYRPLDTHYSYVTDKASSDAFFSDSQFIGFGFRSKVDDRNRLRVAQVFPGSPAEQGGFLRGAELLEINGRDVPGILAAGDLSAVLGPSEVGVPGEFTFRTPDGEEGHASLTKQLVTIPTVSTTRVYDLDGRRVGYVGFENFVTPSEAALDTAFLQLRQAGANDLVLDLRYNGGGLLSVAQHLAGLIGDPPLQSRTFAQLVHNDKQTARNRTYSFPAVENGLGVGRLVVITTGATASASEMIVNGLRAWMPVAEVGETTYGKPVGQYGFDFCDKVLYPVSFAVKNANGEGDYYNGIPPTCPAADDLDHPLGDTAEASLAEALGWLRTGACGASGGSAGVKAEARGRELRADSWRVLLGGAY